MISGETRFSVILYGLYQTLRFMARRHPTFAQRLAEKNLTAQMRTADNTVARWYTFKDGRVSSGKGLHRAPDVTVTVANADLGARLFWLRVDHLERHTRRRRWRVRV